MAQPILTYTVDWGTGNVYQKLSGKSYVKSNGQTVDCSSITVTFSSSVHFKKFYATAVKNGNDYGFINDILVDIRETNPTGILLHELTQRNANVEFNFTINVSQLTAGDGQYRIGLYVQDDNNIWNYEYFLIDSQGNYLQDNQGNYLQVPIVNEFEYINNNIINFTWIDSSNTYNFQAENGMNWNSWVNSQYNIRNFKITTENVTFTGQGNINVIRDNNGQGHLIGTNSPLLAVLPTDLILANYNYTYITDWDMPGGSSTKK